MKRNFKEELKTVLHAVKIARNNWLSKLESKTKEIQLEEKINHQRAFNKAIVSKDVHEEYLKLVNVYAIVGNDVDQFISAVEDETQKKVA